MRRRGWWTLTLLVALLVVAVAGFAANFSLSSLEEPGRLESYVALRAKRWLIARHARNIRIVPGTQQSTAIGQIQFRGSCAACHGFDGRQPSELGRWMYPRASDLGSTEVQQWSDAELFWIIKNGIRFAGMPGFGKVLSDEQIWPLVHYLRTLPEEGRSTPGSSPR